MKKIYLLALALTTVLGATAQYKYAPAVVGRKAVKAAEAPRPQQTVNSSDTRDLDIFYTNTFGTCSDWDTYNAFDEGYSDYITGIDFQCGTAVPSGPAAIAPIASTTAANGYMMVDSDQFGGETGGTWVENCWFQNSNPIDCSGRDHVSLRFQTFYRMWDGGASDGNEYCLVEVSNDGVTWPDVTTYEVSEAAPGTRFELWPTMETQDPVDNPTTFVFDISQVAANSSTVYLRFRWKGTFGYAWMVDDLELFVTPENDLSVAKVYNGDIVADYEYSAIPVSQIGDIVAGAVVANYGFISQTNVNVDFDLDGTTYTAIADEVAPSSLDTIWSPAITVPATVGAKTITVTLPADDDEGGNVLSKSFDVTDNEYAHVSNDPTIQRTLNDDAEVSFGTTFVINNNVTAGGIKVRLGSLSDANVEVQAFIYIVGANIQELEYLGSSLPFFVSQAQIDSDDYITIGFNESGAVDLEAGVAYVVELRKYESSDRIYLVSDPIDEDLSTVCYGPFGTGDAINWFIGWGFTPAIRLVLDGSIDVSEVASNNGVELFQNMPNPANGITTIKYNLTSPSRVELIVRDMTGRMVMTESFGATPTGTNSIQIDTTRLGSGMYTYTLVAGDTQITKQMMVK